ncbi:2-keto-4-pentenoate hydratase [Actinomadura syzygii]|nr:fumarylacetoacetate hydrolase family protein [Actinomadura syzygii]
MTGSGMTTEPSQEQYDAAVRALFHLARGNLFGEDVPPALRAVGDAGFATGLRLQLGVLAAWEAAGERLGGWKIGLTSRGARDGMGEGVRPHGFLLESRILASGARVAEEVPNLKLEPEVGVVLGKDLAGPDVTVQEARDAVEAVVPALEVNSGRLVKGMSVAVRLGNSLNSWGIVVGEPVDPASVDLAALSGEIGSEEGVLGTGETSPATLDDPYLSLTRVCRSLALNGRGLKAGQHLITGSITAPVPVAGAHNYYADFGALGRVELEVP